MGLARFFDRHIAVNAPELWARLSLVVLTILLCPANEPLLQAQQSTAKAALVERCPTGQLLAEAAQLRSTWQVENMKQAITRYQEALSCAQSAGSTHEETIALREIGNLQDILGDHVSAIHYYHSALTYSRVERNRGEEARALIGLSSIHSAGSDAKKSIDYGAEALAIGRQLGDKQIQSDALNNLGYAYYFLGDLTTAQQHFNEALNNARSSDNQATQAEILVNLAYIYTDSGKLNEARSALEEARSLSQTAYQPQVQARALTAIGGIHTLWGENQKALEYHQRGLQLFQMAGDRAGQAITLNGIGSSYEQIGENEKALNAYSQALEHFRATGNRNGQALAIQYVGNIHVRMGHKESAETCYMDGLSLSRNVPDPTLEAYALNNLGVLYQSSGETRRALDNYWDALKIYNKEGNRRASAYALNNIGYALTSAGQLEEGLTYHRQALALIRSSGDRQEESLILYDIARAHSRDGKLDDARLGLEEATSIAESLRTNVVSQDSRASYFSTVRPQYELYIDVLMQLHRQRSTEDFEAKAFAVSERAHARSLLESLKEARADINQGVNPALLEEERSLRQELTGKAERHIQLLYANNQRDAEAIAKEIDQITSQYDQLRTRIKTTSPRYAALTQPQPLTLREIQQQVLDDNSLLLEYALGDDRSYLWAVTRSEVFSYELPGRAKIEGASRSLYDLLTANQPLPGETFEQRQSRVVTANEQLPPQIANLSKILLEPVAAKLGTKRLLIVADGALQFIPFQILTKPADPYRAGSEISAAAAEPRPLVADHEIVNEPSASALALLIGDTTTRKQPSNSVAVFADPVFEVDDPRIKTVTTPTKTEVMTSKVGETELHRALRDVGLTGNGARIPRLPASRDEADAIMAAAPWWSGFKAMGFEASRATAMRSDLGDYRIVHFATHGFLNDEHPELSGVVLSLFDQKGQPQDGFLRLHDIYNLKLPVDLVVLSACNTALGKDVKGEGLIGLTRGFMYAGASSVVASLWKVDDEATAELMRLFYGYMLRDGLSPAAALRKAQVTMSQQKRWQSPYYWAGFVIQGQYIQNQRASRFPIPTLALWLLGATVVSAAGFYALKRRRKITL